jgi:hypothetical protein
MRQLAIGDGERPTICDVGTSQKPLWLLRRRDPDAAHDAMLAIVELRVELLRAATVYGVRSAMSWRDASQVSVWREWLEDVEGSVDRVWASANRLGGVTAGGEEVPEWPALLLEQVLTYQAEPSKPTLQSTTSTQEWIETLERLAERARNVEALNGRPLGEIEGEEFGAGVALLGAVEDSLVLVVSMDPDKRARRVDAVGLHGMALAARDAGVWDLRPSRSGKRARGRTFGEINPADDATIAHAKELTERLVMTTFETVRVYQELAPDRRELASTERTTVHERLDVNALCLRDAHSDRDVLAYLAGALTSGQVWTCYAWHSGASSLRSPTIPADGRARSPQASLSASSVPYTNSPPSFGDCPAGVSSRQRLEPPLRQAGLGVRWSMGDCDATARSRVGVVPSGCPVMRPTQSRSNKAVDVAVE